MLWNVVRPDRFERPTFWFVARRSIQLSYGRTVVRRSTLSMYRTLFPSATSPRRSARISNSRMTDRLYYTDAYLRDFTATVTDQSADGRTVYLDRTAFYPTSGGQPFDTGSIGGAAVLDVLDEEDRVAHRLASPVAAGPVDCAIDWRRRYDHMQQHTGQHLVSAVFEELFALRTVSFHLGAESATIDVEGRAGRRAHSRRRGAARQRDRLREPAGRRAVRKRGRSAGTAESRPNAKAPCGSSRSKGSTGARAGAPTFAPPARSARSCCGRRRRSARRRASSFYAARGRCGGQGPIMRRCRKRPSSFRSASTRSPQRWRAQLEAARGAEKARKKIELDLAAYRGRELYQTTAPGVDGVRRASARLERGSLEEVRAVAQNFTAQEKAVFVATLAEPPSVLLATSADSGIDAGQILKAALQACGGRGGGTARMAQGSVPDAAALAALLEKIG